MAADPIRLDDERKRRRPRNLGGRPLAPATHLDDAVVALIDARAGLHALAGAIADIARNVDGHLGTADLALRALRPKVTPTKAKVAA